MTDYFKDGKIKVTCSINKSSYQIRQLIQRYQLDYIVDDSWNYSAKVSDEQPIYRQLAQNIKQNYFSIVEYMAFGNNRNDVELLVHTEKSCFIGSEDFANQLSLTSSQVLSKDNNQIAKLIEKLC